MPGWALVILVLGTTLAHGLPPGLTAEKVRPGHWFTSIRFAPDGRLFATQLHTGKIFVFQFGWYEWATVPTFYDVDRGLHSLAFHPDFPDSPYVYVGHSASGDFARVTRLVDLGGVGVDPVIFVDSLPCAAPIHMGGRLGFGPDRMLYVTTGDTMDGLNSQNPDRLEGKILRYGPGGLPAPDNPFGVDSPVAMMGVRNPYGLSFDPLTGVGYFTENGPECDDEVNIIQLGMNYGWGGDGVCGLPPVHTPLAAINPTIGPTGSVVCRGGAFGDYEGDLFFGSVVDMGIRRVHFAAGTTDVVESMELFHTFPELVLDVTVGPDGMLWVATELGVWVIRPIQVSVEADIQAQHFSSYPNPFSDRVSFVLPSGRIDVLELWDITGRLVRRWSGPQGGAVTWDGRDDSGRQVPPGVYFARAVSPNGVATRRVVRTGR